MRFPLLFALFLLPAPLQGQSSPLPYEPALPPADLLTESGCAEFLVGPPKSEVSSSAGDPLGHVLDLVSRAQLIRGTAESMPRDAKLIGCILRRDANVLEVRVNAEGSVISYSVRQRFGRQHWVDFLYRPRDVVP